MEACAQLREYNAYFDEPDHRQAVQSKYGLSLYRPKMFVVIGRKGRVNPLESKRIQSDVPGLNLLTYDDIILRARERARRMTKGGISSLLKYVNPQH
jgi:hypothetical protein